MALARPQRSQQEFDRIRSRVMAAQLGRLVDNHGREFSDECTALCACIQSHLRLEDRTGRCRGVLAEVGNFFQHLLAERRCHEHSMRERGPTGYLALRWSLVGCRDLSEDSIDMTKYRHCIPPAAIEDDRGLDTRHARTVRKLIQGQVLEVLNATDDDMHDHVVATGDEKRRTNFRDRDQPVHQLIDRFAGVLCDANHEERFETNAQCLGIHLDVSPAKDS